MTGDPKLAAGHSLGQTWLCLEAHPRGNPEQASSCSFAPSFSISLGVLEKREGGELVKGKLVHN